MLSEILQQVSGIGGYTAVSTVIFVLAFAVVIFRTAMMTKSQRERLSALPFEGGDEQNV